MIKTLLKPLSFLPALMLMYMIYSFSAQPGEVSSALSYKVSYKIVQTADYIFDGGHEEWQLSQWADKINFITRKLAHMTEYFALAVAVSFPLYVYGLHGFLLMLVAGIICVGFSCGDEYHQSFVAGRSPAVKDVCIDNFSVLGNHSRTNHLDQRRAIFRPRKKRRRPLLMSMSTNRNQPGRKLLQSRRRSFLAERRKTVGKNIMNPRRAMDPRAVMDPDRSSRYTGIPRHGGLPTIIMARRISTIPGMRKIRRMGIILKMETILRMETMSRRRGITTRKITMSHRMAITTLKTTTSPRMATTPGAIIPRKTVMIIRITTIRTKITSPRTATTNRKTAMTRRMATAPSTVTVRKLL
ncbi:MAG: VanZ family protein [Lachnospiraceae bacterium]